MIFSTPKVKSVFEIYDARHKAELVRMRELGPKGMALRDEFLLPIGRDVGRFLHSLILAKKPNRILEIGTSYGYSTLFLADAAAQIDAQVISLEIQPNKQKFAAAMIAKAGLSNAVDFRLGDAVQSINDDAGEFDFILLDVWKELYVPCLEAFYPKLSEEAIIASDNMIFPLIDRPKVKQYRQALQQYADLRSTLLPIGSGIELSSKWSSANPKL